MPSNQFSNTRMLNQFVLRLPQIMANHVALLGLLAIANITAAQTNISRIEYYVDSDPGYGNGINVPFSGTDNISTSFNVDIIPLTQGVHVVGVRSRDVNGAWSLDNRWIFLKPYNNGQSVPVPSINRVEYYVDDDPGYGNAINLPVTTGPDISGISFSVNLNPLAEGVHIIGLRSRDSNGAWSVDNRWLFVKPYNNGQSIPVPNISYVEWYLDTDPGLGNGNAISISPGQNLSNLSFSINLTPLFEGVHIVGVRSRDVNGAWSHDNRWLFIKPYSNNQPPPPRSITRVEYYLDNDPGYGNGTEIALMEKNNLGNQIVQANISSLNNGTHKLYFRSRDNAGAWSLDNVDSFVVSSPVAAPQLVMNSISKYHMCLRDSFKVGYDITGSFVPGNTFKAYLSNAAGDFAAETEIGSITSNTDNTIACQLPGNIADGSGYKIRVKSSNPSLVSNSAPFNLNFFDKPFFANDSTVHVLCATELVNLYNLYNPGGYALTWTTPTPAIADTGIYKLYAINSNGCSDTVTVTVAQDIAVWLGNSSSNWHTASNWSTGKIPYEKTHVIINSGTPNNCVLSSTNVSIASLQVKPGAILNVTNNRQVNIASNCSELPH